MGNLQVATTRDSLMLVNEKEEGEVIIANLRDTSVGKVQEVMDQKTGHKYMIKRTMGQGDIDVGRLKKRLNFLLRSKENIISLVSLCQVKEEGRWCANSFYDIKFSSFDNDLKSYIMQRHLTEGELWCLIIGVLKVSEE